MDLGQGAGEIPGTLEDGAGVIPDDIEKLLIASERVINIALQVQHLRAMLLREECLVELKCHVSYARLKALDQLARRLLEEELAEKQQQLLDLKKKLEEI